MRFRRRGSDAAHRQLADAERVSGQTPALAPYPGSLAKDGQGRPPGLSARALADAAGNAREASNGATTLKGVVASLHYAKNGEPNGDILETGEFVHLRPHHMQAA